MRHQDPDRAIDVGGGIARRIPRDRTDTLEQGSPVGIDVLKVARSGIVPLIDGGLAGRGGGQIGAGVLMAPIEPFIAAAATYPAQSEATTVTP